MNSKSIKLLSKLVLATLLLPTLLFGQAGVLYNQTTKDVMQTNLNRQIVTQLVARTSLGIGVTNPAAMLQVSNSPAGASVLARIGTNATSGLTVNSNGNVGIGTTAPAAALHVDGSIIAKGPKLDVRAFGAYADAKKVTDAVLTASSNKVTSATANFTNTDVGKLIWGVETASGAARLPLCTITSVVNSTTILCSSNNAGAYSGIHLVWGHDDTIAIQLAGTNANLINPKGIVYLPTGGYIFSNQLFNLSYATTTATIGIEGDGHVNTKLYVSPNFPAASLAAVSSMVLVDANASELSVQGILIDGCSFAFATAAANACVLKTAGGSTRLEDVWIQNFFNNSGSTPALRIDGSHTIAHNVYVLNGGAIGIYCIAGFGTFVDCGASNCRSTGLYIQNSASSTTNQSGKLAWYGGTIDENGFASLYCQNAKDVTFTDVLIYASDASVPYAAYIDATSDVSFKGCSLVPFSTSGGRGGLQVISGGVARVDSTTRIDGQNGIPAITNNGTIYGNPYITKGAIVGNPPTNNFTGNVGLSGVLNAKTNIATFSLKTNFLAINTKYTNDATLLGSRRSFLWANVAVTNTTPVTLCVDQDADGTYEENYNTVVSQSVGVTNILHISDMLQPGAFFVITNVGPGTMGVLSGKLTGL